ncbi:hypothetical protein COY28_01260 [Candidatus Woesearchaeota archaeon CG_4_10_14_0_2_um_filter_57_5]|nr:MAG: hypothetical protein COV94_05125 [Candidatus Woesearchaeota archaeon CG11_big_fil_rev_8_21_14_0_20_57_5]PIZ56100.1 MAG: hypothetical protein COY28_01260 [Candidatus Woesearchaeota archaeon CG_4_10_14_0_2_um_filter_57_5]
MLLAPQPAEIRRKAFSHMNAAHVRLIAHESSAHEPSCTGSRRRLLLGTAQCTALCIIVHFSCAATPWPVPA